MKRNQKRFAEEAEGKSCRPPREKSMAIKKEEAEQLKAKIEVMLDEEQKIGFAQLDKCALALISGLFGSGKTFLSVAYAALALKEGRADKIFISRSIFTKKEEDIGLLPGELSDKLAPYVYPILQNFEAFFTKSDIEYYLRHGQIEMMPTAFMRGITVKKGQILILDEAQSCTRDIIKKVVTRIGVGGKVFLVADYKRQIDLKDKKESGIYDLLDFEDKAFAKINLTKNHRHPIVNSLVALYDKLEGEKNF